MTLTVCVLYEISSVPVFDLLIQIRSSGAESIVMSALTVHLSLQAVFHRGAGAEQRVLLQSEPSAEDALCHVSPAVSQLRGGLLLHHSAEQRGQCLGHITGPPHTGVPLGYAVCSQTNQEVLDDGYSLHRGMNTNMAVTDRPEPLFSEHNNTTNDQMRL